MFKNYLMTALRNINRQKMYSVLNISGMVGYLGLYEMYDGEKNVQKLPRHGG